MTERAGQVGRQPPGAAPDGTVSFTAMADGTAADYRLLQRREAEHAAGLPDRVLGHLGQLADSFGGYRVSRLEHSVQAATRARRDGAGVDWVVAALVHDIGDLLAPDNHSELAAALLQPYVPADVHWVVRHHGLFQQYYYAHHLGGDRNERDRHRAHPYHQRCIDFCHRWDQVSFDPDYPSEPLEAFEADLRQVLGRRPWDPTILAPGSADDLG